jgi:hypothetical protein
MRENTIIEGKYYYPKILRNQNITAKNNIVWLADMTHLKLNGEEKLEVFMHLYSYKFSNFLSSKY